MNQVADTIYYKAWKIELFVDTDCRELQYRAEAREGNCLLSSPSGTYNYCLSFLKQKIDQIGAKP